MAPDRTFGLRAAAGLDSLPEPMQAGHAYLGLSFDFPGDLTPILNETSVVPGKHLQTHFIAQIGKSLEPFEN
jgi:hypothetical protein